MEGLIDAEVTRHGTILEKLSRGWVETGWENERRRLRRDLHDGLGPQLASLAMLAEAAHNLVPINPARAQEVLEDLAKQAHTAVADVRRLVYALRPPAIDPPLPDRRGRRRPDTVGYGRTPAGGRTQRRASAGLPRLFCSPCTVLAPRSTATRPSPPSRTSSAN